MKFVKITATASYLPSKIITNDDLSKILDTSDDWIFSRTGIKERRISIDENTSDLAKKVAEKLIKENNIDPKELDFILVSSMTPDYESPSVACMVQGAIGADNAWATDISAACSGFVYALNMAEKMIQTGCSKGMVIASDVMSKVVDWTDRRTAVLFGDGAGGVILETSDKESFLRSELKTFGQKGNFLQSGFTDLDNPWIDSAKKESQQTSKLYMDGREIFNFVTGPVGKSIRKLRDDNLQEGEEIDYYLLHQANLKILDIVARKLKEDRSKFLQNIKNYGNTSSATIAILLDEAIKSGDLNLNSGQKILLSGFGGGLTYGNLLIRL